MRRKAKSKVSAVFVAALLCLSLSVSAGAAGAKELVPLGQAVGIQLKSEGVMIVGLSEIENDSGSFSPAGSAGIKAGDVLVSVGNAEIKTAADFITAAESFDGGAVDVTVRRGEQLIHFNVTPVKTMEGNFQLGLWMRDGINGIGTMTFYDPQSGLYGALGHGISDADGALLPMSGGSITGASVIDIVMGESNKPGELCGRFDAENVLGSININCESGIFGIYEKEIERKPLPVASESEIKLGAATIYSNVQGEETRQFSIEISRVYRENEDGKSMMIRVTDEALLAATGGIVQGMSGSPIIQDGKIIGAVTHVLISDPTRGYAINIEKMLEASEALREENAA